MTKPHRLRAVLDTNVIFAALFTRNPNSPLAELLQRWYAGEFDLLYSEDLLLEYREKLTAERRIDRSKRIEFLAHLRQAGVFIVVPSTAIQPLIPDDPDDDVVIACAVEGEATHLVTYDPHFAVLGTEYEGLQILDGLRFLYQVRGDTLPRPGSATRP